MKKALTLTLFGVLAVSMASAAAYRVSLMEPAVVKGQELKAGNYQVHLKDNSVVLKQGKSQVEVPAKIENTAKKFSQTKILYHENNGKLTLQEIELGGTTTKLLFDTGVQSGGGE